MALLRRAWKGFWLRPGGYLRVLLVDVIFHQKLFRQSIYRWLAHTMLVVGFTCTFIFDMTKGFTTFYLLELNRSILFFGFAHEFETGSIRPFIDFFLEFFSFLILIDLIRCLLLSFAEVKQRWIKGHQSFPLLFLVTLYYL